MRRLAVLTALALAGCGPLANHEIQKYQTSKAQDLVAQYERARTGGDLLDMCVKAKLTAIAYEDAGSRGEAGAWRARETIDCRIAYDRLAGGAGGVSRTR